MRKQNRRSPDAQRHPIRRVGLAMLALAAGIGLTHPASAGENYPDEIVVNHPGLAPEAIVYDAGRGELLIGGMRDPGVYRVAADGTLTALVKDPALTNVIGFEVDPARNRLLVCNADLAALSGARGQAMLGVYALDTGEPVKMIDLTRALPFGAENFFPNDVAIAPDGTAYITDSAARLIYVVSPEYAVSVIAPPRFLNYPVFFLNGIEVLPDGNLLVAEMRQGQLLRVMTDGSEKAHRVQLSESLVGVDGIVWHGPNTLVTVSNETNRVSILETSDDWQSAEVRKQVTLQEMASTAAMVGDSVYVLHPHFEAQNPPAEYEIEKLDL
mgnify:FL=1